MLLAVCVMVMNSLPPKDIDYLHQIAREVTFAARVAPGAKIENGGTNTTGYAVRVPGGTQSYYPAFWVRDAAMMLGGDLVPASEVEGWVKVIAATQPGPEGINFPHGLHIPPYSIPDHITLQGAACWFPGAYAEQGVGDFGHLPPADDAFFFVQMVDELVRLSKAAETCRQEVRTGWGTHPLWEVALRAYQSVEADIATGLVVCSSDASKNRVDWGFCDSVRKSGKCLMPSLLRWQAATRLSRILRHLGKNEEATQLERDARLIQKSIVPTFLRRTGANEGLLMSASELGRKDDIWSSAFAVWLGILKKSDAKIVAIGLSKVVQAEPIVLEGQVRHLPVSGPFGGAWETAMSTPGTYQNGGYWATPTGWLMTAIHDVNPVQAQTIFSQFIESLRKRRESGAPFEWVNPKTGACVNPNYGSSAGLVYVSVTNRPSQYER